MLKLKTEKGLLVFDEETGLLTLNGEVTGTGFAFRFFALPRSGGEGFYIESKTVAGNVAVFFDEDGISHQSPLITNTP